MLQGLFKSLEIVSVPVSDWQRSKQFYGETLGLPVAAFMTDEVGWMEFGEKDQVHFAISMWNGPEPFPKAMAVRRWCSRWKMPTRPWTSCAGAACAAKTWWPSRRW